MSDGAVKRNWLAKILPDLSQVFGRFPVASLVAVALWLFLIVSIANGNSVSLFEHAQGLVAVFIAAGAGHLFAEGRGWSRAGNLVTAAAFGAAVAAVYYFYQFFQTSELFLYPALLLLLLLAPYLHRRAEQSALWQFGLRLGLAFLLATIAGLVFGLGLSSIVLTLDYLLGITFTNDIYEYIWVTAIGLVGPLYGLALVPADLEEEIDIDDHRNTLLERGVSVLVNYVIVPLVVVYSIIIHAYAAKIAVTWTLPRGEIGTIVCLFAAASVSAWLIAWPWREKGVWLLRQYTRFWFWLIPVPAVLLAIATYRRVAEYGVTPERYGLALVVVWTIILFAYLLFHRKAADMRAVIGVLAILLLAGSFGPWGAYGVTAFDHLARVKRVFAGAKLPMDGTLDVAKLNFTQDQETALYQAINALGDVNGLAPVVAMLPDKDKPKTDQTRNDRWTLRNELRTKLRIDDAWQSLSAIVYNAGQPIDVVVPSAARLIGPIHAGQAASASPPVDITWAQIESGTLKIKGPWGSSEVKSQVILDAIKAAKDGSQKGTLAIDISNGHRIAVTDAYGDTNSPEPLSNVSFWLMLKQ